MLSDTDIKQQIEDRKNNPTEGIYIDPFEEKYLTPVGYDFRVGLKGFSWKNKREIDIEKDKEIEIEPNDTVVIETLESVSLSKEVGATIHAMVSKAVLYGLSHISTTIDPGWTGKLLISVSNYRDSSVVLRFRDSFCTVCFHKMESESKVPLGRPADRDDIWGSLLEISRQEKKKKEKENVRRNILIISLIMIVFFCGAFVSLKNPDLGSALAAFIALISPVVYDRLKSK
ncbi:deoxycytidine deaminase [Nostoc sp. 'Peltigera membranacea cyanobiont' 210A]|uniref:dCTP deaminase n=1 Tax=Nostoc sp. 'Peltigera membranacea cyanobiont' 210A TaxID=2014529 RepID=UPI000B95C315|nr:deoxycytidine deaminase [Nostoc sp. 'Peltigera membranacea cyanobiont' 210A]OYD96470.1 deoxycytidine deaminase [Nostoc sp. 'Peltigera membranacea cyanobiont' 210A]